MRRLPLYICSLLIVLSACTSIDCPVKNTVYTVYSLKKADGTADSMHTDTLWVWSHRSNGTDTMLSRQIQGSLEINCLFGDVSTFDIPISHTQPEDELYLLLRDTLRINYVDTVRIKKENHPHFESVDCQASYFHTITAVSTTHHFIDSIVINNPHANYDATNAHFHLYLKTQR